eukprot:m.807122 g.807122  ORF g.807122 m.807122 type:complete len:83 (-) comp59298_c0_seq12:14-262(-)
MHPLPWSTTTSFVSRRDPRAPDFLQAEGACRLPSRSGAGIAAPPVLVYAPAPTPVLSCHSLIPDHLLAFVAIDLRGAAMQLR